MTTNRLPEMTMLVHLDPDNEYGVTIREGGIERYFSDYPVPEDYFHTDEWMLFTGTPSWGAFEELRHMAELGNRKQLSEGEMRRACEILGYEFHLIVPSSSLY